MSTTSQLRPSQNGSSPEPDVPGRDTRAMSMIEHLSELRHRIVVSIISVAVAFVISFLGSLEVMELLKRLAPEGVMFIQLSPGEVLLSSVKLAFMVALALASPVVLYQLLRFVLPALTRREQGFLLGAVVSGTVLFAMGVVFAYFVAIPSALGYLLEYGQQVAQSQMSIHHFVSFCSSLLILTGILFELPMVLFLLSYTGLITSAMLLKEWRMATVIMFVIAALVTPSQDPFTMILVGGAMMLLYGASILPIKLIGR